MNRTRLPCISAALCVVLAFCSGAWGADRYDDALTHQGRPPADIPRDAIDHPAQMLRLAGIGPGMHVADVLGANGYYSELASYLVGANGRVYLINNPAYDRYSTGLTARLAGNRLPNVEHVTVDLNDMKLKPASLDVVLLIKVYHDLYWVDPRGQWPAIDAGHVLEQLARALKPGGRLLLVDHVARAGTGTSEASRLHRIDEAYAIHDFESHGFRVAGKSELLRQPADSHEQRSDEGPMVGKTDRFVVLFRKG